MPNMNQLEVPEGLDYILAEGATLHAYRTGGGLAAARLINPEDRELLGYGLDDCSMESALNLACKSYAARELGYADRAIDLNHPESIYDDFRVPVYTGKLAMASSLDSLVGFRDGILATHDGTEVLAWPLHTSKEQASRGANVEAAMQALLINSTKLH